MLSFRNRLLILLTGLVVGAQTVTYVTALARTRATERERADAQLVAGAQIARRVVDYRERQLANAIGVLAADYGLREAVASGDRPTMASALGNHAARIGAELTAALDREGRVLAIGEGTTAVDAGTAQQLALHGDHEPGSPQFLVADGRIFQVFTAPVLAPDEIARVALGFEVDDAFAREIQDLVGVRVEFRHGEAADRAEPAPSVQQRDGAEYLTMATRVSGAAPEVYVALLKPMDEVLAPYRRLARNLALIFGATLLAAIGAGVYLGRSAARPVQRLSQGAQRVAAGDYSTPVDAGGARELSNLASAFNAMQAGIAQREARLLHVANHDDATGLPNRRFAEDWLTRRLQAGPAADPVAVILLVVTNLQEMSAGLGRDLADQLLAHIATQLSRWRGDDAVVARIDAARFLVLAGGVGPGAAAALAREVRTSALQPMHAAGVALQAAVVVGVACTPTDTASAAEALRCAEAAIESAGQAQQTVTFFRRADDEAQQRRLKIGVDLPAALAADELHLVYQPKQRLVDGTCRSVEALVRWDHPQFGALSPAEFVAIAERTGASGQLTRWVLGNALRQLADWHAAGLRMELAVNLSATDIVDPELLQHILESLRGVKVPADCLVLEITESAFIADAEAARRNMDLLRIAGVRFSVDDFGTGYSSLSQLRQLAVDELKIDRSFIRDLALGSEDAAVIRAIVQLGHGIGLRVVAEGVETEEQRRRLIELGCDYAQGYLISKPQTAAQLEPLLRANGPVVTPDEAARTMSLRVLELRRLIGGP
jgi:diguanylate cyclase (GGDEF)-like protein